MKALDVAVRGKDSEATGSQRTTCMTQTSVPPKKEKRRSRRVKIAKPLRVRPSDPKDEHFEDLPVSVNASKDGIFFLSRRKTGYYAGMRVFVTFPFTSKHDPMNCEYVGEVVRVEGPAGDKVGIAVKLLMTMNLNASAKSKPVSRI